MICEKCGKGHDGSFATGRFCSRSCSASRNFSAESRKKKSLALKGKPGHKVSEETKKRISDTQSKRLSERPFEELSWRQKRHIVISEQQGKCLFCRCKTWRSQPLLIEIDHIVSKKNGLRNDSRGNLRGLCPNCHSQTPNFRGKDQKWKKKK